MRRKGIAGTDWAYVESTISCAPAQLCHAEGRQRQESMSRAAVSVRNNSASFRASALSPFDPSVNSLFRRGSHSRPRSAIISSTFGRLNEKRKYQRTQVAMISGSKWRPLKMAGRLCIIASP